jgi:hypothetical protein
MTSIDELIRDSLSCPEGDAIETTALSEARASLEAAVASAAAGDRRPGRWPRVRISLRQLPALVGCAAALLVGATVLVFVHHRSPSRPMSSVTAGLQAAAGLGARLGVLRRVQTAADQLPPGVIAGLQRQAADDEVGRLLPALSRLVAVRGDVKLYLAVTTPASHSLWPARDGDQVTIVATTPRGSTLSPGGIPAVALSDPDIVRIAGLNQQAGTSRSLAQARRYAYSVAIVPDGVARVRWTFATSGGSAGEQIDVPVHDNTAAIPLSSRTGMLLNGIWFAADGRRVTANDNAVTQAVDARQEGRQRQALATAERQHIAAPARLLNAFAVFAFNSPTGTRLSDGYTISRPSLTNLPFSVLNFGGNPGLDLRQTRRVQAPSGLSMYVVPGRSTLCVFESDPPTRGPYGRTIQGGGGACAGSLALALAHGSGVDADNSTGAVQYGIVPKSRSDATIILRGGRRSTLHPEDGVYIVPTPFKFG